MFYHFSYHLLLELHYGDKLHKSQSTREQVREAGVSIREAEQQLDAKLFLDKYPRWGIEGPHQSIILHNMLLHAAEQGWKEAERFICWGCWQSLPRLYPEVDVPTIQLVGYQNSHIEIRDLYHDVYLLRRLPSPTAVQAPAEGGGYPGHPVLPEEPLAQVRGHHHAGGRQTRGCCSYPLPVCQWESWSGSRRRERPAWWGPLRGQRGSPVGPGGHPHAGT